MRLLPLVILLAAGPARAQEAPGFVPAAVSMAERIADTTWKAPENLKKDGKVWRLYGTDITSETEGGRLACARVASILLKRAGAGVSVVNGVGSLERQLRGWTRLTSLSALEPGDVIVWTRRFADEECTGGGDCHVGIYWGSGLSYDNWGALGHPARYPVAPRLGYSFSRAYRAR